MGRNICSLLVIGTLAVAHAGCGSDGGNAAGAGGPGVAASGAGGSGGGGAGANGLAGGATVPAGGSSDVAGAGYANAGAGNPGSGGDPNASGMAGGGLTAAGAGGSSGSPGAAGGAGSAGSGGGGPPASGCNGALLCDDFESYAASAKPAGPWKLSSSGTGSIVVDSTHVYSGTKAAHFHGTVGKDAAYMLADAAPIFPVKADTLFVRFMMYIERWSIGNPMHNRLVWVGSESALRNVDGTGYAMETYNGIGVERIASGHYRTTAQRLTDMSNLGKWLCWEMEIDNKGGPVPTGSGTARPHLFREGTDLTMAISGNTANWNAVPFDLLQFSLFAYQTDTAAADYWVDDIVMDTKRVGCPTTPAAR